MSTDRNSEARYGLEGPRGGKHWWLAFESTDGRPSSRALTTAVAGAMHRFVHRGRTQANPCVRRLRGEPSDWRLVPADGGDYRESTPPRSAGDTGLAAYETAEQLSETGDAVVVEEGTVWGGLPGGVLAAELPDDGMPVLESGDGERYVWIPPRSVAVAAGVGVDDEAERRARDGVLREACETGWRLGREFAAPTHGDEGEADAGSEPQDRPSTSALNRLNEALEPFGLSASVGGRNRAHNERTNGTGERRST